SPSPTRSVSPSVHTNHTVPGSCPTCGVISPEERPPNDWVMKFDATGRPSGEGGTGGESSTVTCTNPALSYRYTRESPTLNHTCSPSGVSTNPAMVVPIPENSGC